jgi:acetyl/propionyl-CoA carboxylase alpha subunit
MSSFDSFTSIRKVLIANRGEIACRIIKSCKQLGLTSIAIYTPADRSSSHVRLADEAWLLPGPDQSAYIEEDAVLEIAKKSGAHAVIPGYGMWGYRDDADDRLSVRKRGFCGTSSGSGSNMGWSVGERYSSVRAQAHRKRTSCQVWCQCLSSAIKA